MTSDILKRAAEAQTEAKAYFEANGIVVTNPGLVPELIAEIERLTARAEAAEAREAALLAANDVNRKLMLERNAEVDRYGKRIDKLRADLANAGAVMVEASVHRRTGIYDRDGREICVGDHIRINLESQYTKREYWHPEYEVVWKAPAFTLKHIGGDRGSDTAIWYFSVPQKSSTSKIETIHEAPTLSPIAAAARVLLANTEAENDPEIGPWLRALAEQEKSDD